MSSSSDDGGASRDGAVAASCCWWLDRSGRHGFKKLREVVQIKRQRRLRGLLPETNELPQQLGAERACAGYRFGLLLQDDLAQHIVGDVAIQAVAGRDGGARFHEFRDVGQRQELAAAGIIEPPLRVFSKHNILCHARQRHRTGLWFPKIVAAMHRVAAKSMRGQRQSSPAIVNSATVNRKLSSSCDKAVGKAVMIDGGEIPLSRQADAARPRCLKHCSRLNSIRPTMKSVGSLVPP